MEFNGKSILERAVEIAMGLRHEYYEQALERAADARFVFSKNGEGQREVLKHAREETPKQLNDRLKLTHPETGAVVKTYSAILEAIPASGGQAPLFEHPESNISERVKTMIDSFYKNRTLYRHLFNHTQKAVLTDPNRWMLCEKGTDETTGSETAFLVFCESENVPFFELTPDGKTKQFCYSSAYTMKVNGREENFTDYRLYDFNDSIRLLHTGKVKVPATGEFEGYEQYTYERENFLYKEFAHNLGFVPAMSMGVYESDESDMLFDLFYEPAIPLLKELAVTTSLLQVHQVKQLMGTRAMYVKPCEHIEPNGSVCINGYMDNVKQTECPQCHGLGYIKPTTEQDDIVIIMPNNREDMINLAQLQHTFTAPIEIATHYAAQKEELKKSIGSAIFRMDNGATRSVTATEVNYTESIINQKLIPIADTIENLWEFAVVCFIKLFGGRTDYESGYVVSYTHTKTLLKESLESAAETLKALVEAGAPLQVQDKAKEQLLRIQMPYEQEKVDLIMAIDTQRPFRDKTAAETAIVLASRADDDYEKQLHENWAKVMEGVENAHPEFNLYAEQKRKDAVRAIAEKIFSQIKYRADEFVFPDSV